MAYEITVDSISRDDWEHYASVFADYSIYQTWAYQETRADMDKQEISRIVIKDESGEVATMGHVRIKSIKLLGLRIGYMQWGPLLRGPASDLRCTEEATRTLRAAYLGTQVNVLRIVPNVTEDEIGRKLARTLEASGFDNVPSVKPCHTMFLPLGRSNEQLRKGLHQSWRRQLRKAERARLEVVESATHESFEILRKFYLGTVQRKGFRGLDPWIFTRTQRLLSPAERMSLILAYDDGRPVTAHLTSNLGNSAVFLLGGSCEEGLSRRASYLTWWKAIVRSNKIGMKRFDVGGVDFEKNPTVSRFKAGIGGKEVFYIGVFEACDTLRTRVTWRAAEAIHNIIGKQL